MTADMAPAQIIEPLASLAVDIDSLVTLEGNPRKGDVDAVAASLDRFGQRKPIVVRASDRQIIAGNHTWQAARQLGWTQIAAVLVDDDTATSQAFALADNRTAELGSYDDGLLLELIKSVGEADPSMLLDTGWSEDAVRELVDRIDPGLPDSPPSDDAPEPPAEPYSKLGDVWILGSHRLVCGDATVIGAYDALLGDAKADCVWTDPPYGVAVAKVASVEEAKRLRKRTDGLTIQNDDLTPDHLEDFLRSTLGAAYTACKPGGSWYVAAPSGDLFYQFATVLRELGVWRHTLVWVKDQFTLGRADYHYRHESIFYGWKEGAGHEWFGGRDKDTVLEVARPKRSPEHPSMKPVELVTTCLDNSAPRGGIVLDPFGGSGTTLMACEYTGRKARLIELDPRYVDVICRRWQEHTGAKPVLESTGEPHDFAS
jgi:DNA modification methylase